MEKATNFTNATRCINQALEEIGSEHRVLGSDQVHVSLVNICIALCEEIKKLQDRN